MTYPDSDSSGLRAGPLFAFAALLALAGLAAHYASLGVQLTPPPSPVPSVVPQHVQVTDEQARHLRWELPLAATLQVDVATASFDQCPALVAMMAPSPQDPAPVVKTAAQTRNGVTTATTRWYAEHSEVFTRASLDAFLNRMANACRVPAITSWSWGTSQTVPADGGVPSPALGPQRAPASAASGV